MESIFTPPESKQPTRRILAIEPDPARASALRRIVRTQVRADLEIVTSTNDAIRSITERVPDLVLTPPLLPPSDEAALISHLKKLARPDVQAIIVPQFVDTTEPGHESSRRFEWLLRRSPVRHSGCDPHTLAEQIEEYLEEARAARMAWNDRQLFRSIYESRSAAGGRMKPDLRLVKSGARAENNPLSDGFKERANHLGRSHARDRRRTTRHRSNDLPWLKTMTLSLGAITARIVDVSSQGVLAESGSKFLVGTTVDLQLLGQKTRLCVPARVLRSEVSEVDTRGVTYRMAAAFAHDLNILELETESANLTPPVLADVLGRVLRDCTDTSGALSRRVRLEQELRQVLPVRDVLIRDSPVPAKDGSDSIYFTVRQVGPSRQILQVIFEPDSQPSPTEFRFLKAAADLAAVALEFCGEVT
jgi:hypothetical protein